MTEIRQGNTGNPSVLRIALSETCTAYHLGRLLDEVDMLYSRLVAVDRYKEMLSTKAPPSPGNWVLYARRSLEKDQRLEVLRAGSGSPFSLDVLAKVRRAGSWLKGQLPRLLQYSPQQLRELGDLEIEAKGYEVAAKRVGVKREEQEVVRAALENTHSMLELAEKAGRLGDRNEAGRVLRAILDPVEGLARLKEEGFLAHAEIIEMDEPPAGDASRQLPSPKEEAEEGVASREGPTEGGKS